MERIVERSEAASPVSLAIRRFLVLPPVWRRPDHPSIWPALSPPFRRTSNRRTLLDRCRMGLAEFLFPPGGSGRCGSTRPEPFGPTKEESNGYGRSKIRVGNRVG